MGVLMLAAEKGSQLMIRAEGADADDALAALGDLIARGFEEMHGV
jgi:phosphocarrier protein